LKALVRRNHFCNKCFVRRDKRKWNPSILCHAPDNVGFSKEAIIATEKLITKEKLSLDNFNYDIHKFTAHVRI
jgi:hypothetical protein